MILDFHARLTPAGPDRLECQMERHGVSRAVVCAGGMIDPTRLSEQIVYGGHVEADPDNEAVLAAADRAGGTFIPFYFANPHRDPDDYAAVAWRFRGVEISPAVHGVGLDDPRTIDLVTVAESFGHPVYVVCIGRPGSTAADLVTLARKFPAVSFVLGHCGYIGIDFHAVAVIANEPNVFAETSGCYTAVARCAVGLLGADRVVFGSEQPAQDLGVELQKIHALGLTDDQWRDVTWRSAKRLLGKEAS